MREKKPIAPKQVREKEPNAPKQVREKDIFGLLVFFFNFNFFVESVDIRFVYFLLLNTV